MTQEELKAAVLADRLASYARLRGGFPVPMAGGLYWLAVAGLGFVLGPAQQVYGAFFLSGAIFPVALGFAALFRNDFMKDKTATGTVLGPAFVGMLLFWPMMFIALQDGAGPTTAMAMLAIGMGAHWPVIGWSYGRAALFSGHAIARAAIVLGVAVLLPAYAFLAIPLAVAGIYAVWTVLILIDSAGVRLRLAAAAAA